MTHSQYMQQFSAKLSKLPQSLKQEILEDINSHFEEGTEAGISEETLAERLGAPESLAREYLASYAREQAEARPTFGNMVQFIWASIGVGLFYLILVLPIVLIYTMVWIALIFSAGMLILAGVLIPLFIIVNAISPLASVSVGYPMFTFFVTIALGALGGLLWIFLIRIGKVHGRWLVRVVKKQTDKVKRRRNINAA